MVGARGGAERESKRSKTCEEKTELGGLRDSHAGHCRTKKVGEGQGWNEGRAGREGWQGSGGYT